MSERPHFRVEVEKRVYIWGGRGIVRSYATTPRNIKRAYRMAAKLEKALKKAKQGEHPSTRSS